LPSGWLAHDPVTRQPWPEGETGWGWASLVLPFLEQNNLVNGVIRHDRPVLDPLNDPARVLYLPVFRCSSDIRGSTQQFDLATTSGPVRLAVSNYVGMFGTQELEDCEGQPVGFTCRGDGSFQHQQGIRLAEFIDGTSNTLMAGERSSRIEHSTWVGVVPEGDEAFARILGIADHPPNSDDGHLDDFMSQHPGGTNFILADGSVRMIAETVDLAVYTAQATRGGGEAVSAD
jgi:prepilin-type processing-associated H-X9-DG protein